MQYLDMENASLIIEVQTSKKLFKILNDNASTFKKINIKRITLVMSKTTFLNSAQFIEDYIEKHFSKKNVLFMIKFPLDKSINISYNNFVFINTSNEIFSHKNVYNELDLTKLNIHKISSLLNDKLNVIVNPIVEKGRIKELNDLLLMLYENNENSEILLGGFLIPISLMKEHPCNAYLCDGWVCKKKISKLPRSIIIKKDGCIYPHDINSKKLLIGNINEGNLNIILKKFINSTEYINWNNLVENVFIKYVSNYPYELFPFDSYLKWEANK